MGLVGRGDSRFSGWAAVILPWQPGSPVPTAPPPPGRRRRAGPPCRQTLRPRHRVPGPPAQPCSPRGGCGVGPPGGKKSGRSRRPRCAPLARTLGPPPRKHAGSSGAGPAAAGCPRWAGTLTRRTLWSRGSRAAAGWASPRRTPAASCRPGRRCSPGRGRGCWSSGGRAGPLDWSPGTARFRERSAGGPPCARLPGRAATAGACSPGRRREARASRRVRGGGGARAGARRGQGRRWMRACRLHTQHSGRGA